jgi:hypothetical protein
LTLFHNLKLFLARVFLRKNFVYLLTGRGLRYAAYEKETEGIEGGRRVIDLTPVCWTLFICPTID